jgi:hypothetical protein
MRRRAFARSVAGRFFGGAPSPASPARARPRLCQSPVVPSRPPRPCGRLRQRARGPGGCQSARSSWWCSPGPRTHCLPHPLRRRTMEMQGRGRGSHPRSPQQLVRRPADAPRCRKSPIRMNRVLQIVSRRATRRVPSPGTRRRQIPRVQPPPRKRFAQHGAPQTASSTSETHHRPVASSSRASASPRRRRALLGLLLLEARSRRGLEGAAEFLTERHLLRKRAAKHPRGNDR